MSDVRRLEAIDILRGILVICVVLGHAVQQYAGMLGPFWTEVNRIIYSFHMPAFVFVAGLCALRVVELSGVSEKRDYIRSRAVRLLVPYVVWGLIYFALRLVVGDIARIVYRMDYAWLFFFGYNPDGAMWFLWSLFAATALVVPCAKLFTRGWFLVLVGVALMSVVMFLPHFPLRYRALTVVPVYSLFLGFGLFVRLHLEPLVKSAGQAIWVAGAGLMVFSLAAFLWCSKFAAHALWFMLTSVSASLTLFALASLLARSAGRVTRVFAFLGAEAMSIYVLGEPVKVCCRLYFKTLHLPVGVSFALMVALMLALPVLLSRLIAKSSVLSALLLGVRAKTRDSSER